MPHNLRASVLYALIIAVLSLLSSPHPPPSSFTHQLQRSLPYPTFSSAPFRKLNHLTWHHLTQCDPRSEGLHSQWRCVNIFCSDKVSAKKNQSITTFTLPFPNQRLLWSMSCDACGVYVPTSDHVVSPLRGPRKKEKKFWLPPRHMAPEGPYRYRSFNMLPVKSRRSPVDRGAQRRALQAWGGKEGGKHGNKRRFLNVFRGGGS